MGMGCMSASHEAMDRGRQCVGEEPQGANASRVRMIAIKSPKLLASSANHGPELHHLSHRWEAFVFIQTV